MLRDILPAVFILLATPVVLAQEVVPPVQTQTSSATLRVTPDPNRPAPGPTPAPSPPPKPPVRAGRAITLVIDYSGSMHGEPLRAARRSAATLVDLIRIWRTLYPVQFADLEFQFIQFGGPREARVLHPLSTIADFEVLKRRIAEDQVTFGNTDFRSGLNAALGDLRTRPGVRSKTLFLTDAADHGAGPEGTVDYRPLGDTQFIIFGRDSVDSKGWLRAVAGSTQTNVTSEYEVTALFVSALFDLVDDISQSLVRRGEVRVDAATPFRFIKHGTAKHTAILTRPGRSFRIRRIVSASGQPLGPNTYQTSEADTFIQLRIDPSIPPGEYAVEFSGAAGTQKVSYISFEPCDIYLRMRTVPEAGIGECFVENSAVNFEFEFWDTGLKRPLPYADFLNFTAHKIEIRSGKAEPVISETSRDTSKLRFERTFASGSAGKYEVFSAWSYNLGSLQQGQPRPQLVGDLCIDTNGTLVRVSWDADHAWEGRSIVIKGVLARPDSLKLQAIKTIGLKVGDRVIGLEQTSPGANEYEGVIADATPGSYPLSVTDSNATYRLALDGGGESRINVQRRVLVMTLRSSGASAAVEGGLGSKLRAGWDDWFGRHEPGRSRRRVDVQRRTFVGLRLPFHGPHHEEIPIELSLNKLFPDEQAVVRVEGSGRREYAASVHSTSWGGLIGSRRLVRDAAVVEVDLPQSIRLDSRQSSFAGTMRLTKKAFDWNVERALYPEARVNLRATISGGAAAIDLTPTEVVFEVVTDGASIWTAKAIRAGKQLILGLIALLAALTAFLLWVVRRRNFNRKLEMWSDNAGRSPEDFYEEFPERVKARSRNFVAEHGADETIFPALKSDSDLVRERRALRHLVRSQDGREFDRFVARVVSRTFLEGLADRVRKPNVAGVGWQFAIPAGGTVGVEIASFTPDTDPARESVIRVRHPADTSFGTLTATSEGVCRYTNPQTVAWLEKAHGTRRRLDPGSSTVLESGAVIHIGPIEDAPYFTLVILFDDARLLVTVKETQ